MAASTSETRRYLKLKDDTWAMTVTLTEQGRTKLAELRALHPKWREHQFFAALFEDFTEHGWQLIDPSEVGMTASRIGIVPDTANDKFNIEVCYWHEAYAVEDAIEELMTGALHLRKAA